MKTALIAPIAAGLVLLSAGAASARMTDAYSRTGQVKPHSLTQTSEPTAAPAIGDWDFDGLVVALRREAAEVRTPEGEIVSVPLNSSTYVYYEQSPVAIAALDIGDQVSILTVRSKSKGAPKLYVCIYIRQTAPGHPLS